MSSVRMCDRCSTIFSENADGWTTLTGSKRVRKDGRIYFEEVTQDLCPTCVRKMDEATTPALEGEIRDDE